MNKFSAASVGPDSSVILCSHTPMLTQSHEIFAQILSGYLQNGFYIGFPAELNYIAAQSEELRRILADPGIFVFSESGLRNNYDAVLKKAKQPSIYTLGYGYAELAALGGSRPVIHSVAISDGRQKKMTESASDHTVCTGQGFAEISYDDSANRHRADKSRNEYDNNLVRAADSHVLKFFVKGEPLTYLFIRKLKFFGSLRGTQSPFTRALPLSLLYKDKSGADGSVCGYVMERFDSGYRQIGDFTYSRFNGNVSAEFKGSRYDRFRMLLSLAECFVYFHSRDILLSDIKPDNFFVDPSDLSVFPIDSDGFSYNGGYSQPPQPIYSDVPAAADISGYRQIFRTELFGLAALIFFLLTNTELKSCPYDLSRISGGSNKREESFYGEWRLCPPYIREIFAGIRKDPAFDFPSAYRWKRIFEQYLNELNPETAEIIKKLAAISSRFDMIDYDIAHIRQEIGRLNGLYDNFIKYKERAGRFKAGIIAVCAVLSVLLIFLFVWVFIQ